MARQPVWQTIHETLRREIASDLHRTGDRLPTEKDLSLRFGVNRHTVRRALAELRAEGAIYVRRGSGAYVAEGIINYRLGDRVKFSKTIMELGRSPAHKLLAVDIMAAPDAVADHLRLKRGSRVIRLETLGEADGLPINLAEQYLPAARFEGLEALFAETLSLTQALRHFGITDYRRAWTRIMARAPSRAVAMLLRQPETIPVLRTEGLNVDMAGQPIEYARGTWAGGRTQFTVEE